LSSLQILRKNIHFRNFYENNSTGIIVPIDRTQFGEGKYKVDHKCRASTFGRNRVENRKFAKKRQKNFICYENLINFDNLQKYRKWRGNHKNPKLKKTYFERTSKINGN